ncbi:amidohydrolase [Cohnella yongneupensis]|uniref:Amidohydrolase n=1 Tax=Cohnella yongneupensis TaxID=425006 RepID=A0ABW0R721_9BACL
MMNERTLQLLYDDMVGWRRHLHANPELSFREIKTSRMIADLLSSWGLEVRTGVAGTGVVAKLVGGKPGRTIALRSDIDALPIQDEKNASYQSTVPGVMHACGHDGHTAELLGVARYYSLHREDTVGTRVFLFQPGEEFLPGGAISMIADGALDGVDAIFGVHLWSPMPFGLAGTRPGSFMASPDEFEIEIIGRGGHAGLPHESKDALVTGSALVMALQTIVSRNVNPLESGVLSIGKFNSGTAFNVIAERCLIGGTIRTFTPELRFFMRKRLEDIVKHICEMHGCDYKLNFVLGYPPVVNDEDETARWFRVAESVMPGAVILSERIMAGEDFSYYLKHKPGCFFFVGAGEPDGASAPHHHPRFDIDERAMLNAAKLLIAVSDDAANDFTK